MSQEVIERVEARIARQIDGYKGPPVPSVVTVGVSDLRTLLSLAKRTVEPSEESLAYAVANAKLGEGPSVRCEGPTDFEIATAREWVRRVRAAMQNAAPDRRDG